MCVKPLIYASLTNDPRLVWMAFVFGVPESVEHLCEISAKTLGLLHLRTYG